ncbi:hypothetical protein [Microbacterium sp. LWH13-1.2]|uniref:hypothetical protein n=1 Tax=Microbacterium sp. LWH13-1.2 TaxID=3135260 RepID=UPI003138CFDA
MSTIPSGAESAVAPWNEIESLVGRRFVSEWLEISDEARTHFDKASYLDHTESPFDPAAYPEGLVEGFHLLALLDHLVGQVSYVEADAWTGWNYGLDRVRFTSPVTSSDRVRVAGEITQLQPRTDGYLVTYDCVMELEGAERPAMVATWKALWSVDEEDEA